MKISLNWLRDYVDVQLPAAELADRLTQAGLETEGIEEVGDDTVIELETTSNRPDHLGHIGVAREVAWICETPLRLPELEFDTVDQVAGKALSEWVSLHVEDTDLCPRYTARLATDVEVGESPEWLRKRLEAIGLRSVSNVVDITNYVLFEWGQPLHAFDYEKLEGGSIVVRRAAQGEDITVINGKEYPLTREDLVIADSQRAVAVAGVMGGLDSEVSPATKTVLLESAWFDPVSVRTTSRRLGLGSDASYRFERRVDPQGVENASLRFCQLLQKLTGAKILTGHLDALEPQLLEQQVVRLRPSRVTQVLGVTIPRPEIRSHLSALGFDQVDESGDSDGFRVPSFRADVDREIDLVEEVARVYGFDAIPEGTLTAFPATESPREQLLEGVKTWLVGAGYREALTFSFVEAGPLQPIEDWWDGGTPYEVRNPVRSAERFLRRSLLPNLLQSVRTNRHGGVDRVKLFETGNVFHRQSQQPRESLHLAWACLAPELDLRTVRGIADGIFRYLGLDLPAWMPLAEDALLDNGAGFEWDGRPRGVLGSIQLEDVHEPVWCGELDLGPLIEQVQERPFQDFSRMPAIRRDLNMVFSESVAWRQIERELEELELEDLIEIDFVDLYRGKQVPQGHKSLTFSLLFRSDDRTLTHEEADVRSQKAIERLKQKFEATLR